MAGILKALGFESKPEYAEKIPETLTPEDFSVHRTFHHGFPSQPICLAYEAVQQVLAIGTETGAVLLLGKPGLERYFTHPHQVAVLQMVFITNKGLLVTRCDNKTLYLWSLREKEVVRLHSLEYDKENPTVVSHTFGSQWLYVGTEKGNVHAVHVDSFMVSGYTIHWNECIDYGTQRTKPGEVIGVYEHPLDQSKVLVAFSANLCVLWNLKSKGMEKRYIYNPENHHIMTSVCWLGNGKNFATSYSDGSIAVWYAKIDNRPEKIFFLHGHDSQSFQPIYKLQVVYTDGEPWYVCSGGFPEDHLTSPQTLTVQHSRSSTLLSASSTIMDFICLPSSPFATEVQKPFALVVLAKNELIVHDLQTPGYPSFCLPYALDLHSPPVTSIQYFGNCPEEFVASLHSVKSKMMCDSKSTKPWPLKGGKWGEESPHQLTDLILTGHTDGSIRLWFCSSVIFQPFFTLSTSRYFKMLYSTLSAPPKPKPSKRHAPRRPPPPVPRATQPPSAGGETVTRHSESGVGGNSRIGTNLPKSTSSPAIVTMRIENSEEFVVAGGEGNGNVHRNGNGNGDQRTLSPNGGQNALCPATGQVGPEVHAPSEGVDGAQALSRSHSTGSDRKVVFSREKKSLFKKKRKEREGDSASPEDRERADRMGLSLSVSTREDKGKSTKSAFSFRKTANKIKFGRKFTTKGNGKHEATSEEVDAPTAVTEEGQSDHQETNSDPAEDPGGTEHPGGLQTQESRVSEGVQTPSSPGDVFSPPEIVETPSQEAPPRPKSQPKPPQQATADQKKNQEAGKAQKPYKGVTPTTSASHLPSAVIAPNEDDFFAICEMNMCVWGQWLCVATRGGGVLAFDFHLIEKRSTPQTLNIDFSTDSVINHSDEATRPSPRPEATPGWVFQERVRDSLPGFRLVQHCQCLHSTGHQLPVVVSNMQYSVDFGLLTVGTNHGLAVVDTQSNTCLYTLSNLTSILYMAEPSKFSKQVKRESSMATLLPKPTISRRQTTRALPHSPMSPPRSTSTPQFSSAKTPSTPGEKKELGVAQACLPEIPCVEECDCSVTALQLVQLQLDKHTPPTLTLWVGTASGKVAAYGVNIVQCPAERKGQTRKIELIPTNFILDNKSPIVSLHFLNEWGDRQVVPYKPSRTQSVCIAEDTWLPARLPLTGREVPRKKEATASASSHHRPQNYAIVVEELRLKSFSFPGMVVINKCVLPLENDNVILKSEYFYCNDLPCLLTVTSCLHMHVHSLPGLKPLVTVPYPALADPRVMCTFRVSGDGQALHMTSPSEIQRLCITRNDRLNLPNCVPDFHVLVEDPQPASKGIIGNLFSSGPVEMNREATFGENAGRPYVSLAKRDGRSGCTYNKRQWQREAGRAQRGKGVSAAGAIEGQFQKNREALDKRGKQLTELEQKTEQFSEDAGDFASLADKLRKKYEK